jgi:glycosyltransferase involved in cell wall biosynthesis
MRSPKRVLVVQPSLQPPGGGNGVCAWLVEALKDRHDVTLLTWRPVDFGAVDRHYGTSLAASGVACLTVGRGVRAAVDATPATLDLLRMSLLLRACRRVAGDFDVVVTANNEADFGRRGIQYVHFPSGYQEAPRLGDRWYHAFSWLVPSYYSACVALAGYSRDRMRENVTIANSRWTADRVAERHGIEASVLYPPVAGDFPDVAWERREDGFVCLGRFAPEKRIERAVAIVGAVRAAGADVRLHLVGAPEGRRYFARVKRLARENARWVTLHVDLSRQDLARLVASQRFGIHAMRDEPFGMAVGEMIRAGCVVFAPRGGGQSEIVDDPRLTYDDDADAVAKILRVLASADEQTRARAALRTRAEAFSREAFVADVRRVVERFPDPA